MSEMPGWNLRDARPHRTALFAAAALFAFVLTGCGGDKKIAVPDVFRVKFDTTQGDIIVEARKDWAPRGVDRFHELVRIGYFKEGRFFRVVPNFIAQFGVHRDYDIHARWREYFILDDPRKESNLRGYLSFAQSGPNTRATEIFINLADNSKLLDDQGFVPFAKVVEGMDAVDKLYSGYGEMRPEGKFIDPGRVENSTNAYLVPRFPKMDWIRSATFVK
jgi:peptidyl-prolyl cis-trans isomerase A (cyclophilin A)